MFLWCISWSRVWKIGWIVGLTSLLYACTPQDPAKVTVLSPRQAIKVAKAPKATKPVSGDVYRVKKGETLFQIAKKNRTSIEALAKANNLRTPYTIYPGQKLKLVTGTVTAKTSASKDWWKRTLGRKKAVQSSFPNKFARFTQKSSTTSTTSTTSSKTVATTAKVDVQVASRATPVRQSAPTTATVAKAAKPTPSKAKVAAPAAGTWMWPVRGKVLQGFGVAQHNGQESRGINIAGNAGDPVRAAADGEVVYSGNALRGYGNLIILKHDEKYLTAYAHNRKIIVKERERIKKGQLIAEMGKTGTDHVHLHFEIRYHGKPMDPLKVLPKR